MKTMLSSNNSIDHLEMTEVVPVKVAEALRDFILDKRTGNVVLNIKDGIILGLRVEVITSFKSRA